LTSRREEPFLAFTEVLEKIPREVTRKFQASGRNRGLRGYHE